MSRFEDWPIRLNAAIEAARGRPFAWGVHDCALFAFNIVRDLTGVDHVTVYRDSYRTALGAKRALRRHGGGSLPTAITRLLGTPIAPLRAQRGDVVLWAQPEQGDTVGVCLGGDAAFVADSGLVFVPLNQCSTAWRV